MKDSEGLKSLANHDNLKGKCGICDFQLICGGCRARAYIFTKDPYNQDPACAYIPQKK